jgi:formate-dependent nitrite reductase membrane component NrfD
LLWLTGAIAFILAAVHPEAHRLKFLSVLPRSRWLSAASGVSVAYVFVHLLPELAVQREKVSRALASTVLARLDLHVYLIALVGLAVFYGLERMAEGHRPREAEVAPEGPAPAAVFWIHIGSFAVYNALIGYLLLHRE